MKWKADTNAENMGVEGVGARHPHFVVTHLGTNFELTWDYVKADPGADRGGNEPVSKGG